LILRDFDGDGKADLQLRREGDRWLASPGQGRSLVDPELFADPELQARFERFAQSLRGLVARP
jgi:hypothetical protein